jgi:hypothetical protein
MEWFHSIGEHVDHIWLESSLSLDETKPFSFWKPPYLHYQNRYRVADSLKHSHYVLLQTIVYLGSVDTSHRIKFDKKGMLLTLVWCNMVQKQNDSMKSLLSNTLLLYDLPFIRLQCERSDDFPVRILNSSYGRSNGLHPDSNSEMMMMMMDNVKCEGCTCSRLWKHLNTHNNGTLGLTHVECLSSSS